MDSEKSNREKRIDSLPPRLRDKAREKMHQEQNKGGRQKGYNDDAQYEDDVNQQYEGDYCKELLI